MHAEMMADEAYYTCPGVDGSMRGPDGEGIASTAAPLETPNEQSRNNGTAVVIFIYFVVLYQTPEEVKRHNDMRVVPDARRMINLLIL